MLDYPNDFNIPAFPAGKTIAFTRSVSVWISVVFFLIVVACAFLLLNLHFKKNFPFLISIDPFTEEWTVIAYPDKKEQSVPRYQYIQEKLINDYAIDWFTISNDPSLNEQIWEECSIDECSIPEQFNPNNKTCAIACKSSEKLFETFTQKVLPDYRARITQAQETWKLVKKQIKAVAVSENGGYWRISAIINSSVNGNFEVLVFVNVAQDTTLYPATFGYYINQFNAYRIAR